LGVKNLPEFVVGISSGPQMLNNHHLAGFLPPRGCLSK
jgi:hypothetical protein